MDPNLSLIYKIKCQALILKKKSLLMSLIKIITKLIIITDPNFSMIHKIKCKM